MPTDLDNDPKLDLHQRDAINIIAAFGLGHQKLQKQLRAPFELGTASLTEKIVAWFKQRSFFGVETCERVEP